MGGSTRPYLPPKISQFCCGKVFFDGSPYQTLDIMLMTIVLVVVIVARMMMSRVTVVGVVERSVMYARTSNPYVRHHMSLPPR